MMSAYVLKKLDGTGSSSMGGIASSLENLTPDRAYAIWQNHVAPQYKPIYPGDKADHPDYWIVDRAPWDVIDYEKWTSKQAETELNFI